MYKFTAYILILLAVFAFSASKVRGQEVNVSPSASIKSVSNEAGFDYRVENLRKFLQKYDSPLADFAQDFVAYADKNGLDYRLVPSISGVESTFGKQIPGNSFNAYGWANGDYKFKSWSDSISVVSTTLKSEYVDKGAASIAKIARRYAPPSTTWGGRVQYFESKIDPLPLSFDL